MKVRSVANGNIIDLPEGHGLITAGIYVPVEEEVDAPAPAAAPAREGALVQPEAALATTAHASPKRAAARGKPVAPLTTADVKPKAAKASAAAKAKPARQAKRRK